MCLCNALSRTQTEQNEAAEQLYIYQRQLRAYLTTGLVSITTLESWVLTQRQLHWVYSFVATSRKGRRAPWKPGRCACSTGALFAGFQGTHAAHRPVGRALPGAPPACTVAGARALGVPTVHEEPAASAPSLRPHAPAPCDNKRRRCRPSLPLRLTERGRSPRRASRKDDTGYSAAPLSAGFLLLVCPRALSRAPAWRNPDTPRVSAPPGPRGDLRGVLRITGREQWLGGRPWQDGNPRLYSHLLRVSHLHARGKREVVASPPKSGFVRCPLQKVQ
ncbi:hypothetical protein NDU88_007886 [Pleurodeles waltl]|uniref:Uncharacterized protein n=1 Tax=Pleurodeles waltl TaxID=8319 RepID=A0AAV7NUW9_PLEWA|nr:hypothetical protein NDU88_007886 [Pleurodeles waltl]